MAKNKRVKKIKNAKKIKVNILKNKTLKMMFVLLMIAVIIYIIYKVINLIITPTDILMVENGTVSVEETTVRIYYKRRNVGKWK